MTTSTGRARTNLKLRRTPNQDDEPIDVVRVNQQVQILKQEGEWVYVRVDGNEGYLLSKFVVVEK